VDEHEHPKLIASARQAFELGSLADDVGTIRSDQTTSIASTNMIVYVGTNADPYVARRS